VSAAHVTYVECPRCATFNNSYDVCGLCAHPVKIRIVAGRRIRLHFSFANHKWGRERPRVHPARAAAWRLTGEVPA